MPLHSEYPDLEPLAVLVQKQRRLVAGTLRIVREEKELREQMDALLEKAGVDQVDCNGFRVFRSERDGRRFCVVNPIKDGKPAEDQAAVTNERPGDPR